MIIELIYPGDFEISQDGYPLPYLLYDGSPNISGGAVHVASSAVNIPRYIDFQIENGGTALLTLTGVPCIVPGGIHADSVNVVTEPQTSLSPGELSPFTILLTPYSVGELDITLNIQFNDDYGSPFTINIFVASIEPPVKIPKTGQITSYATGDDGHLQKGVDWPTTRFVDNADGTTTDALTGLMWETAPASSLNTWDYALTYANNLTTGGYEDWHFANVNELMSLMNAGESNSASWLNNQSVYSGIISDDYWTSTRSYSGGYIYAWVVHPTSGVLSRLGPPHFATAYQWAVRYAGGGVVEIPKTGKTAAYGIGDDGDLECGVEWPTPRFIDCGNGIIADNLTGLMWEKITDDTSKTWSESLAYAKDLALGGYTDWRLPNRNELRSLVNYGKEVIADWLNLKGFQNVQDDAYWTSTTYAPNTGAAWTVSMLAGHVYYADKTNFRFAWAVR